MPSRSQRCDPRTGITGGQTQSGYGVIDLLFVLVLIVILAGFAAAGYAEYTLRARVSGGIILAAPVKLAVAEYYSTRNTFPVSNSMAGIAAPEDISDRDVYSVTITTVPVTGTIVVAFKARGSVAQGDSVLLIPLKYYKSVLWRCTSNTLIQQLLPAACREE